MSNVSQAYSPREKWVDGCIHAVGVTVSLIAAATLVCLVLGALPTLSTVSVVIYALTLVGLFVASASYHMAPWPNMKGVLRRIDHAAIYLKIAGTYTPLALIKMAAAPGLTLLTGVWAIGLFGAACKLFWPGRLERTSYVLYLVAGWAGLLMLDELMATFTTPVLVLLALGGILYTAGVVFHLWHRLPYHNAVWHGFVLAASACHYSAIMFAVLPELSV